MGQDVYTSISLLIAEELDCSLDAIRIEAAPFDPTNHGNAMLGGLQLTGASTSVAGSWGSMRKVGATVRTMLVSAAAKKWNVPVSSCSTIMWLYPATIERRSMKYYCRVYISLESAVR